MISLSYLKEWSFITRRGGREIGVGFFFIKKRGVEVFFPPFPEGGLQFFLAQNAPLEYNFVKFSPGENPPTPQNSYVRSWFSLNNLTSYILVIREDKE